MYSVQWGLTESCSSREGRGARPCCTVIFINVYFWKFMLYKLCDEAIHFIDLPNISLLCVTWYCVLYCIALCTILHCIVCTVYSIASYCTVLNCTALYCIYIIYMNTPTQTSTLNGQCYFSRWTASNTYCHILELFLFIPDRQWFISVMHHTIDRNNGFSCYYIAVKILESRIAKRMPYIAYKLFNVWFSFPWEHIKKCKMKLFILS